MSPLRPVNASQTRVPTTATTSSVNFVKVFIQIPLNFQYTLSNPSPSPSLGRSAVAEYSYPEELRVSRCIWEASDQKPTAADLLAIGKLLRIRAVSARRMGTRLALGPDVEQLNWVISPSPLAFSQTS